MICASCGYSVSIMKITWLKISGYSLCFVLSLITSTSYAGGEVQNFIEYEDDDVYMRLVTRTSEQLTAFYLAREFPQKAIDEILKTCFITPVVLNKKFDVFHVEPDSWVFISDDKPIERIKRDYWKKIWTGSTLSPAHQATFGWTLMPEQRDLRFDEGVGGSIAIPLQTELFSLKARFRTGMKKDGKIKTVTFRDITCAK